MRLVDVCDEVKDRYRFGFNGQEKVNEWAGIGNHLDFTFRGYDSRTGRFISRDPLAKKYPYYTPYAFAGNTPILAIDLEGLEPAVLFGSDRQVEVANKENSVIPKSQQNWAVFEFGKLDDAIITLKNHKDVGNKIKAVYLQSHGAFGCVRIFEGEGTSDLNEFQIGWYLGEKKRINEIEDPATKRAETKDFEENIMAKNISKFVEFTSYIEQGGTLLLGGCMAGTGFEGKEFMEKLNLLLDHRINVVLNGDFTTEIPYYKSKNGQLIPLFFNYGRTGPNHFSFGWNKIDQDGKINETKKDLKLKSNGNDLYEFYDHEKNEVIK